MGANGGVRWAAASAPVLPKVAGWSGSLSYPLYILHVPLSELIGYGFARQGIQPGMVSGASAVLVVIAAAWVAFILYDQPLRTLLRRRFGSRRHRSAAGNAV
jgi:peptidoglycan/LPS O-acetylase OafA/YrhL